MPNTAGEMMKRQMFRRYATTLIGKNTISYTMAINACEEKDWLVFRRCIRPFPPMLRLRSTLFRYVGLGWSIALTLIALARGSGSSSAMP
mmetsp:Transcript_182648/g.578681  ORF Transcript_182648/g.578681 Transcript_182648/m.578681 type:complete len:90 (+) Transcript_182648:179-448(+)